MNDMDSYHGQYDKIKDDVYYLGSNVVLRMNVGLNKKKEDGTSYNYHNEYMYDSDKYINHKSLVTIKRSYDYYLSIENVKAYNNDKESIMIRPQDMIYLKTIFTKISNWFTVNDLYALKDNKLVLVKKPKPEIIQGLAGGKSIMIEPTVIVYDNGNTIEGVRMFLNSNTNYVDVTVDRIMGLLYTLECYNMHLSAQTMLSSLNTPMGQNLIKFGSGIQPDEVSEHGFAGGVNNRKPPIKKKQKSYFDKIDEL